MLEVPLYNGIPYVLTDWCIGTFLQPNDDFRLAIDQETRWIVPGRTARQKAGEHERQPFELEPASLVRSQQPRKRDDRLRRGHLDGEVRSSNMTILALVEWKFQLELGSPIFRWKLIGNYKALKMYSEIHKLYRIVKNCRSFTLI